MKLINKIHLLLSILASIVIAYLYGINAGLSFVLGSGLIIANINVLSFLLGGSNEQISVAWSSFIIVSKYAVLIALVYFLISSDALSTNFVAAGFVSLILSLVIYALIINYKKVGHGTL